MTPRRRSPCLALTLAAAFALPASGRPDDVAERARQLHFSSIESADSSTDKPTHDGLTDLGRDIVRCPVHP